MSEQPNSSSRSLGHSVGRLMVRGLLGAISITATAAIPIAVQRYFATAPSAPPASSASPASLAPPSPTPVSAPAPQASVQPDAQALETTPTQSDSKKSQGEAWHDRLWKKWDKK